MEKIKDRFICGHCGSGDTKKTGGQNKVAGKYQRWQCNDCGRTTIGELIKSFDAPHLKVKEPKTA